jgi:hypothetical protein
MDNRPEATVRSEANARRTPPPPVEPPDELENLLDEMKLPNLAERMENWGSD